MKAKDKSKIVYSELCLYFPDAKCELNFKDDYTLMVSVILSAQCTDKRVNLVTKDLFAKYPNFSSLANAEIVDVENIIRPCGFFKNKAKNIVNASKKVVLHYAGKLPDTMEDLVTLDGVGRKTANVLLSNIFNKPSIAVDTHVFRVSNRIGLAKADNVYDCEMQLQKNIEKSKWSEMHHLLVLFGRYVCKARKPECSKCNLKGICGEYKRWNGKNL